MEIESGDAPGDRLTSADSAATGTLSVYSQVSVRSYVWPAAEMLAEPGGTSTGAEIVAPGGSGDDRSGGFGQLPASCWGPPGRLIGWGTGGVVFTWVTVVVAQAATAKNKMAAPRPTPTTLVSPLTAPPLRAR